MPRSKMLVMNQQFGLLVVIGDEEGMPGKKRKVLARCQCGREKVVILRNLITGGTSSCGCERLESIRLESTRHGMSHSREHRCWTSMKNRCLNENNHAFKWYGLRGISVCERWMSFESFYADMGKCPDGMSLDRINNDGCYEKDNCRWATPVQQSNNRRNRYRNADNASQR